MSHGTPHDAAEHITATFIRGQNAIRDQEGRRAQMVGNDAMRGLVRPVRRNLGQIGDDLDQRAKQIDGVVVVRALQNGGDAFEAHAGIDRWPRQVHALAALELFVLHEHEVPDLDEAITLGVSRARRPARNLVAVVVKNLRARAAGSGITHRPEIVGTSDTDNLAVGKPRDLLPQFEGVIVVDIDGDQKTIFRQREVLGDKGPCQFDRALLEVVAEREIAEHLEECVMARGIADIVQVVVLAAGAHAFLRAHGARIRPLLQTCEYVLELHHAGIGEHQGGVIARHQRRRRHDLMVVAGEEIEEAFADIVDAAHFEPCEPFISIRA